MNSWLDNLVQMKANGENLTSGRVSLKFDVANFENKNYPGSFLELCRRIPQIILEKSLVILLKIGV